MRAVCEAVLGPDYQIVEVGFDVPFAGAMNQPWHRDFPMPAETRDEHRLTSLAFNMTLVDTEEDMGPFEIAQGTQWDTGEDFDHEMFPPKSFYGRLRGARGPQVPADGRHLGPLGADHPPRHPPALARRRARCWCWAIDGPEGGNAEHHDLAVTKDYWESLPESVRAHLELPDRRRAAPRSPRSTPSRAW